MGDSVWTIIGALAGVVGVIVAIVGLVTNRQNSNARVQPPQRPSSPPYTPQVSPTSSPSASTEQHDSEDGAVAVISASLVFIGGILLWSLFSAIASKTDVPNSVTQIVEAASVALSCGVAPLIVFIAGVLAGWNDKSMPSR